ncbi:alpha/beta hydrolase family esterase [Shewanella donghaensis]|uniref:alpha/beta hydrolase family esterase n=1 Tax=Shewanella donghaensis TaxID=238836 RepID=UPI001182DE7E|nr:prolyl oligopeptidase family serine peptidase [Shewanella donghaensis]
MTALKSKHHRLSILPNPFSIQQGCSYFSKTIIVLSISLIGLLGCGGGSDSKPATKPAKQTETCVGQALLEGASCLSFQNREAVVYQPTGVPTAIAIFLHGAPGHPNKVIQLFDGKMLANTASWLSVAPQGGAGGTWGWSSLNDVQASNIDVNYVSDLLDELTARYNVTSDKVYIMGYSAGGFMAYKLACQIPEKLTAVISLAGQFRGEFEECPTSTAIALHHFHSPSDTDVPMEGRAFGDITSVGNTLNHWRLINGCAETSTITENTGVTSTSSGTATTQWDNCFKPVSFSSMANVSHESSYLSEVLYDIYKGSL